MELNIQNEFSRLEEVILGTAENCGGKPHLDDTYDPKTREFLTNGIYPYEQDMTNEMEFFLQILNKHGVKVHRPKNIENLNQIFSRDLCFVIDDKLVLPEILPERKPEQDGIQHIIESIADVDIIRAPKGVRIEGGDVVALGEHLIVGYSQEKDFYNYKTARSNEEGLEFLKEVFPNKNIVGVQLTKSDYEAKENSLHLDCCFQPLGLGHALIFEDGFLFEDELDKVKDIVGIENLIKVSRIEMYDMSCNVFSIDRDVVVSERGFVRINEKLQSLGYSVEEVPYYQISKLEGLLRCSTMPLRRKND